MSIPLPALDVRPTPPSSFLDDYNKAISAKSMLARIPYTAALTAGQNLQNQQAQINLQQQRAFMDALNGATGTSSAAPASPANPMQPTNQQTQGLFNQALGQTNTAGPAQAPATQAQQPGYESYDADPYEGMITRLQGSLGKSGQYGLSYIKNLQDLHNLYVTGQKTAADLRKTNMDAENTSWSMLANGAGAIADSIDPKTGLPNAAVVNSVLAGAAHFNPQAASIYAQQYQNDPVGFGKTMTALRGQSPDQIKALASRSDAATAQGNLAERVSNDQATQSYRAKDLAARTAQNAVANKNAQARIDAMTQRNSIEQGRLNWEIKNNPKFVGTQQYFDAIRNNKTDKIKGLKDQLNAGTLTQQQYINKAQAVQDDYEEKVVKGGGSVQHFDVANAMKQSSAGKVLSTAMAQQIFQKAGRDPNKARAIAKSLGYAIPSAQ